MHSSSEQSKFAAEVASADVLCGVMQALSYIPRLDMFVEGEWQEIFVPALCVDICVGS